MRTLTMLFLLTLVFTVSLRAQETEQDWFDGSAYEFSGEGLVPGYEDLSVQPDEGLSGQPMVGSGNEGRRGPRPGRHFRCFFLSGSEGYSLAMLHFGQQRGMVRIGSAMYRLENLVMSEATTETSVSGESTASSRQVVAQFQASLVSMTADSQLGTSNLLAADGTTIDETSSAETTAQGYIQGAIVRYTPPQRQQGQLVDQSSVGNRPRRGPRGQIVVEAQLQTADVAGTILGFGGRRGPGGPGGSRGPRHGGPRQMGENGQNYR